MAFPTGDARIPWIGAEDIGARRAKSSCRAKRCVDSIGVAGEHLTGAEMAAQLGPRSASRWPTRRCRPSSTARSVRGRREFGNMWQFQRDFERVFARAAISSARARCIRARDFRLWLAANARRSWRRAA